MMTVLLKGLLPDQPRPMRVLRGPFRGAIIMMTPRHSMRKVLGIYEHELNDWIEKVLSSVTRVVDVGANDGYFSLGCATALRRRGIKGEVIAFEPQRECVQALRTSIGLSGMHQIRIIELLVGSKTATGTTTLDEIQWTSGAMGLGSRDDTLIKIDVEGSELDVLEGGLSWFRPSNRFLIEVHRETFADTIIQLFASRGLALKRINQRAVPLLGRENRSRENFWLVSDLEASA
jgi:hypothetical protein